MTPHDVDSRYPTAQAELSGLHEFLNRHRRLFVLTGAGISTASGIPDYRDERGEWKRPAPVQYQEFVRHEPTRQRYWARSLVGWRWFQQAQPNICHRTLSAWQRHGRIGQLVTQNVDRLHQAAGARAVIDLHGRLDRVVCMACGDRTDRTAFQQLLATRNPWFAELSAAVAPDGDASLEDVDFDAFRVPSCGHCGGTLKPDVVFFGEAIPRQRVARAVAALRHADALLVIGSSLMVYSGFRFCRLAAEQGLPIAAINPGRTRADPLFQVKVRRRFEEVVAELALAP